VDIGQRIQAARQARGWTQQRLAIALTGITGRNIWSSQISRWETGVNPPFYATVEAIAKALNAPELLQLEQEPEPEAEVV
jgi:transcriptional regulator with XRE-family HTH domain